MKDHLPDCCGWEDCHCFHTTLRNEEYAALTEVVDAARIVSDCEPEWTTLRNALSEWDKVKRC